MALKHERAIYVRCEDAGAGPGNTREVTNSATISANNRPMMQTLGFSGSTALTPTIAGALGGARSVTNRSRRYWVTLTCTINPSTSGGGAQTVAIPIAPLQTVWLPSNVTATAATLSANSDWPVHAGADRATATSNLTVDFVSET